MFEVNGNLEDPIDGLGNYQLFFSTIKKVWNYFEEYIENDVMNSIDILVDNATEGSGYTPIITPTLKKFLIIKLHIYPTDKEDKIAYQFAHELMHFVFYTKYGLGKKRADALEESICTAASLVVLYDWNREYFNKYNEHVKRLENKGYRTGAEVAEKVNYKFEELLKMI